MSSMPTSFSRDRKAKAYLVQLEVTMRKEGKWQVASGHANFLNGLILANHVLNFKEGEPHFVTYTPPVAEGPLSQAIHLGAESGEVPPPPSGLL